MKNVDEKKQGKAYKRHVRIWGFLKRTIGPFFKIIFGYSCEQAPKLTAPYLVLSNHNTDLDPAFVGLSFSQQMYFVASEHVYRRGVISKILKWAFEPIAKIKGASDTLTVMKMIRYLRSGKNVCLFPEGNRSFNGKTCQINDATGKLVKTSAATLVTYKITGGFFTTPRWGFGIRKGKVSGKVVNVYTPEQIKAMSAEEVTEIFRRDLYEDAYETQQKNLVLYKGKNRTHGIEYSYCVCPECKEIGVISSKGNKVFCNKCGRKSVYGEDGYFAGDFKFKTIYEWDCLQEEYFKVFAENTNGELFKDGNITMRTVTADHGEEIIGTGDFSMSNESVCFTCKECTKEILISQIPDMSIYGKCGLMFTDTDGVHYELSAGKKSFYNARKYLSCWNYLRRKKEEQ